jgi:hypothetical protein
MPEREGTYCKVPVDATTLKTLKNRIFIAQLFQSLCAKRYDLVAMSPLGTC